MGHIMNDQISSWLRRNAFLAAAAGLPIVVLAFFLAATEVPKWLVAAPKHDPVFALTHYDNRSPDFALQFKVEKGRLKATAVRITDSGYTAYQKLYRYRVRSGEVEEILVDVPDSVLASLENASSVAGRPPPSESFEPGSVAGLVLNTNRVAPDGYEFTQNDSGHRGLFGELFGMGRGRHRLGLSNSGRFVAITPPDGVASFRYNQATFIAWAKDS
jgi:hypothetical protein